MYFVGINHLKITKQCNAVSCKSRVSSSGHQHKPHREHLLKNVTNRPLRGANHGCNIGCENGDKQKIQPEYLNYFSTQQSCITHENNTKHHTRTHKDKTSHNRNITQHT